MKSITKNYLYNTVYTVLNIILPLVTAPYLSRVLGTEGIGIFTFYFAIAQWFALVAKLGLTNYGTRFIAGVRDDEDKLKKHFSEIYMMQLLMTFIVSVIYLLFTLFIAENKQLSALFAIWIASVIFDTDWFLFGLEEFRSAALRSCAVKIITTASVFVFVRSIDDLWKYALITAISYAGGYLYLWLKCRKYVSFGLVKWKKVADHIKPCFLLMIPTIALSIYRSMDKVMLGSISTMSETGLYENAEKLIYALCSFIASLGVVMMPRMSNLAAKKDKEKSETFIEKSLIFLMFLSIGMCFGLLSISNSLIPILYGDSFIGSIPLLNLLAVTLIFIAWGNVIRTQFVIPNKKDSIYIGSISFGAVCNLIVNAILIPHYGALGACIGTIAAELSVPLYQFVLLRKQLLYRKYFMNTIFFFFSGIVMFCLCKYIELKLSTGFTTMVIQIIIGAILYGSFSLLYLKKRLNMF